MIHKIEALNYKGLKYISQIVHPFQILVGPNSSGKSTFLDVISLISDFVNNGAYSALLLNEEKGIGRAGRMEELIFNQSSDHFKLAIELVIPEYLKSDYKIARYEVAFGKSEQGTLKILEEKLSLKFPNPPVEGDQLVAILKGGEYFYVSERPKNNTSLTRQLSFKAEDDTSILFYLLQDNELFPVALWVKGILTNGIQVLSLNSTAMRKPVSPSARRNFRPDGSNLPHVIKDFEKNNLQEYSDWIAHVKTILPEIDAIKVIEREEDRHSYVAIKYNTLEHPVPSWLISDGTLRILALTLIAYLPEKDNIYLIEEPENGVHPKVMEGLFQSLSSVYNNQVFVATHSPTFVGLAELSQLLCFAKNPSGAISIINGENHPALTEWKGQINLDTLYAGGVLG